MPSQMPTSSCRRRSSTSCSHDAMSIVEGLEQTGQMGHDGQDNQDMEDLVRTADIVEPSRVPSLRNSCLSPLVESRPKNTMSYGVYAGAKDIQSTLQNQPRQSDLFFHLLQAIGSKAVHDGKYGGNAHAHEHGRSVRPPSWRSELW